MAELHRANWVICPKCKFRYYVGVQLLLIEGIPAICPQCRNEFEAKKHLEPSLKATNVGDRWY